MARFNKEVNLTAIQPTMHYKELNPSVCVSALDTTCFSATFLLDVMIGILKNGSKNKLSLFLRKMIRKSIR